uniref:Uncharacterized protein n=1 Tax=Arundo donax TaxID=35708 RepID=A0A0A8YZE2_ARUDO
MRGVSLVRTAQVVPSMAASSRCRHCLGRPVMAMALELAMGSAGPTHTEDQIR